MLGGSSIRSFSTAKTARAILARLCRQHGLALKVDRVLAAFASLQVVDLSWADGRVERRVAPLTPVQAQVLQTLHWPLPETYAVRLVGGR